MPYLYQKEETFLSRDRREVLAENTLYKQTLLKELLPLVCPYILVTFPGLLFFVQLSM